MSARGPYDAGRFHDAYDKVMAKWPAGTESVTVPTPSVRRTST